jgi:cytochrome c
MDTSLLTSFSLAGAVVALALGAAVAQPIGDADAGETVYNRECASCHQIGDGARNRTGPHLNRVFDRRAGSLDDFSYSRPLVRMGADGLYWRLDTLDAYIANPRALVSGTRMNYRGLRDETQRANLLAFLRVWSDQPQNVPESSPTARRNLPEIAPDILAIVGDPEYGEYLAQECSTCHKRDGADEGIPSITGWFPEDFVVAMHAYRSGLRPHQVMQMMAQRLDDEQIAALAAYYEQLGAE